PRPFETPAMGPRGKQNFVGEQGAIRMSATNSWPGVRAQTCGQAAREWTVYGSIMSPGASRVSAKIPRCLGHFLIRCPAKEEKLLAGADWRNAQHHIPEFEPKM